MTPPSYSLFSNTVNLEEFRLHSEVSILKPLRLSKPHLRLSVISTREFRASQLFHFLETLPMPRVVRITIIGDISLGGVPPERVVVLHHVESLRLVVGGIEPGCELVTHVSCPSTEYTSLTHSRKRGSNYIYSRPRTCRTRSFASIAGTRSKKSNSR